MGSGLAGRNPLRPVSVLFRNASSGRIVRLPQVTPDCIRGRRDENADCCLHRIPPPDKRTDRRSDASNQEQHEDGPMHPAFRRRGRTEVVERHDVWMVTGIIAALWFRRSDETSGGFGV